MLNEEISNNQQTNTADLDSQNQNQPAEKNSKNVDEDVVEFNNANVVNADADTQSVESKDSEQSDITSETDQTSDKQSTDSDSEGLSEIEVENQELKSKNEQLLLHMADYENRAKRAEQQVKDVRQYAITGFAKDMLVVADNLGRALEAFTGESGKESETKTNVNALVEGVQMTQKELHNQLSKHGIELFDPVGEKFDPNFHQAMFEIPNTDVPNNTIISVQQKGYSIGDRILRPALVGVSKNLEKEMKNKATVREVEQTTSNQVDQATENHPANEKCDSAKSNK